MAMLSIPSYKTDDPNYRYKMPRLVAKVEGRGNGIRTNITNMADIARALKRSPDYPTRFCGSELGAQSKYDPAEGKAIVTGAHEQQDLQSLIDKFIEKFVLCHNCNLPEIDLVVRKGRVQYRCNACGDKAEADNQHKLAAFIIKNPPCGSSSTLGALPKKKLSKEERRLLKASKQQHEGEDDDKKKGNKKKSSKSKSKTEAGEEDQDEAQNESDNKSTSSGTEADTKAKKSAKKSKSRLSANKGKQESASDEKQSSSQYHTDDILYFTRSMIRAICGLDQQEDTSSEVEDERLSKTNKVVDKESETKAKSKQTDQEETECVKNEETEPQTEVQNRKKLKNEEMISEEAFNEEFSMYKASVQCTDQSVCFFVGLESLFSEELGGLNANTLEQRLKYLRKIAKTMEFEDLLIALQDFLYFRAGSPLVPEGYKAYASILYGLYNLDMLEGDDILKFYSHDKFTAKYFERHVEAEKAFTAARDAAQPFITWYKNDD